MTQASNSPAPEQGAKPNSYRHNLVQKLEGQIEKGALREASITIRLLLRHQPDDPDWIEVRDWIEEQLSGPKRSSTKVQALPKETTTTPTRKQETFVEHDTQLHDVIFTPDSTGVIACGGELEATRESGVPSATVWNIKTKEEISCFSGHSTAVLRVAISPRRPYLVTASAQGTLGLWDSTSTANLRVIQRKQPVVRALCFSSDGGRILSAGNDPVIRLWDVDKRQPLRLFKGSERTVNRVAFLPGDEQIIGGGLDGKVRIWSTGEGTILKTLEVDKKGLNDLAISENGSILVTAGADHEIQLWDLGGQRRLRRFKGHLDEVTRIAISPDGRWILSGSDDKSVRLWSTEKGKQVWCEEAHTEAITGVAFSPDGKHFASVSLDRTLRVSQLSNIV